MAEIAARPSTAGRRAQFQADIRDRRFGLHLDCAMRMAREHRPNIPGATYHVMNRGNHKQSIFEDDRDRRVFDRIANDARDTYGVKILSESLMGNHFHLAVVTPHGNLSEFMQHLEGEFARYSNWRHRRVGHLFQGRFRHVVIEHDLHLITALCYIFMNPVTAGMVAKPEAYRWSTYAATIGLRPAPSQITLDWLETLFPGQSLPEAQAEFKKIMDSAHPLPAYFEYFELNVSRNTIEEVIRSYTAEQFHVSSLPSTYRTALRPDLESLFDGVCRDRARFIRDARILYGYRNPEIAKVIGLKPATVSKLFRQMMTANAA